MAIWRPTLVTAGAVAADPVGAADIAVQTALLNAPSTLPFNGPAGALYETVQRDRVTTTSNVVAASGSLALYGTGQNVLYAGRTYSAANVWCTTAGTISHSWACIVRQSDRAILATSADNTAAFTAAATRTFTFSAAYTPSVNTPFWVGVAIVFSAAPAFAAAIAVTPAALMSVAPVILGASNTGLSAPQAVSTIVTAPTGATGSPMYIWLT